MCAQEEDLLDQELLEEDQDHEDIEAEMEMDPQLGMYECVCSVHVSHIYNAHNNTNTVTLIIFGRAYSKELGWM